MIIILGKQKSPSFERVKTVNCCQIRYLLYKSRVFFPSTSSGCSIQLSLWKAMKVCDEAFCSFWMESLVSLELAFSNHPLWGGYSVQWEMTRGQSWARICIRRISLCYCGVGTALHTSRILSCSIFADDSDPANIKARRRGNFPEKRSRTKNFPSKRLVINSNALLTLCM